MRKKSTSKATATIKEATTKATEAVKETVEKTIAKAPEVIEEAKKSMINCRKFLIEE